MACLDNAIVKIDVSDVSISSGIADEDSRIVMAVQFGGPFARSFDMRGAPMSEKSPRQTCP